MGLTGLTHRGLTSFAITCFLDGAIDGGVKMYRVVHGPRVRAGSIAAALRG